MNTEIILMLVAVIVFFSFAALSMKKNLSPLVKKLLLISPVLATLSLIIFFCYKAYFYLTN